MADDLQAGVALTHVVRALAALLPDDPDALDALTPAQRAAYRSATVTLLAAACALEELGRALSPGGEAPDPPGPGPGPAA